MPTLECKKGGMHTHHAITKISGFCCFINIVGVKANLTFSLLLKQRNHRQHVLWIFNVGIYKCYECTGFQLLKGYLALMRYCARLMLAGVPVMVIWRSDEPSMALAILICAPDICRISFIFVPWRPIMQPISWKSSTSCLHLY